MGHNGTKPTVRWCQVVRPPSIQEIAAGNTHPYPPIGRHQKENERPFGVISEVNLRPTTPWRE